MAGITTAICNSFKLEVAQRVHLDTDVYKLALIKHSPTGTFDKATTNYSALGADELVATGYTAGGVVLVNGVWALIGDAASFGWNDAVWTPVSFSSDGALIYNSTRGGKAVQVMSFADLNAIPVVSSNASFTVPLSSTAQIQLT